MRIVGAPTTDIGPRVKAWTEAQGMAYVRMHLNVGYRFVDRGERSGMAYGTVALGKERVTIWWKPSPRWLPQHCTEEIGLIPEEKP